MSGEAAAAGQRSPIWPLRVLPPLVWAAVVFAFSAQPDLPHASLDLVDLLLRKAAHMAEYAVLAILILRAVAPGRQDWNRWHLVLAWLLTVLYAMSDEFHQWFVPGRTAAATDALIGLAVYHLAAFKVAPILG